MAKSAAVHGSVESSQSASGIDTPSKADTSNNAKSAALTLDAGRLQSLLKEEFTRPVETQPAPEATPKALPQKNKPLSKNASRWLKSIAGLAIVAVVGWMPMQRLIQVSSVEAVLNAPVVTLRAPINGVVEGELANLRVGSTINLGQSLMQVDNPRVDNGGVERATEILDIAQSDRSATDTRLAHLEALQQKLAARVESYRQDRSRKVAAQIDEAQARIVAAEAVHARALVEFQRQSSLTERGIGAASVKEDAERELAVAAAAINEASAAKATFEVEADALRNNRFVGDDYNDEPRSAQRLDEVGERISELHADAARQDSRVTYARNLLTQETKKLALAQNANMAAPVSGRVWEVLTAPGEQVVAGQHLISVLDCSQMMVTAAVSENVYNTLSLGMSAQFRFREGGDPLPGYVAQLSGVAAASSNFAIIPSSLTKEAYRVSVAIDATSLGASCPVGRTGRVVFEPIAK